MAGKAKIRFRLERYRESLKTSAGWPLESHLRCENAGGRVLLQKCLHYSGILFLRSLIPASPTKPVATKRQLPGSGTGCASTLMSPVRTSASRLPPQASLSNSSDILRLVVPAPSALKDNVAKTNESACNKSRMTGISRDNSDSLTMPGPAVVSVLPSRYAAAN